MKKTIFYHAGCPVCISAEQQLIDVIDKNRIDLEVVHLGEDSGRIDEAQRLGVHTVPALVPECQSFHINFGAALDELKSQ